METVMTVSVGRLCDMVYNILMRNILYSCLSGGVQRDAGVIQRRVYVLRLAVMIGISS